MSNRDFKGVWIPKEIWLCKDLSAIDKIIYTEISSLDNEDHCIASNEYFAEFCGVSDATVKRSIKKLIDLGYIKKLSFDGRTRQLVVSQQVAQNELADSSKCATINIDNNINTFSKEKEEPEKSEYDSHMYSKEELKEDFFGSAKRTKKTRTTTRGKDLFSKCVDEINDFTDLPELRDALIKYLKFRLEVKDKPLYGINQWKGMLDKLDQAVNECGKEYVDIVNQSIDKSWLSFYPIKDTRPKKKEVFSEYGETTCEKKEEVYADRKF